MNGKGIWRLSPAYDITFNYCQGGEQSMSINGYGKNIPEQTFYKLGALCDLDEHKVGQVFSETFEALSHWPVLADNLGISPQNRNDIQENFNQLFNQYHSMA